MASDTSGQWHAPSSSDQDWQGLYRGHLSDTPTSTQVPTPQSPVWSGWTQVPRAAWVGGAGLTGAVTGQRGAGG